MYLFMLILQVYHLVTVYSCKVKTSFVTTIIKHSGLELNPGHLILVIGEPIGPDGKTSLCRFKVHILYKYS